MINNLQLKTKIKQSEIYWSCKIDNIKGTRKILQYDGADNHRWLKVSICLDRSQTAL